MSDKISHINVIDSTGEPMYSKLDDFDVGDISKSYLASEDENIKYITVMI